MREPPRQPVVRGSWGEVHWAVDARGRSPAEEFFNSLEERDKAKNLALFRMLAATGRIQNVEKFKKVAGHQLFEFKSFQLRFYGDFRPGHNFVVASAVRKKQDKADPSALQTAEKILKENDER